MTELQFYKQLDPGEIKKKRIYESKKIVLNQNQNFDRKIPSRNILRAALNKIVIIW